MRLYLELPKAYVAALMEMAELEHRELKGQAAWLIVQGVDQWMRQQEAEGNPDVELSGPALPRRLQAQLERSEEVRERIMNQFDLMRKAGTEVRNLLRVLLEAMDRLQGASEADAEAAATHLADMMQAARALVSREI